MRDIFPRKHPEWWMSAWTQKDLREVSPHLTHRAGFLKIHTCPEMKCQIGVLIVIINIYLMHTM